MLGVGAPPQFGRTALILAARHGYDDVVRTLLDGGAATDVQDKVRGSSGVILRAWELALMMGLSGRCSWEAGACIWVAHGLRTKVILVGRSGSCLERVEDSVEAYMGGMLRGGVHC